MENFKYLANWLEVNFIEKEDRFELNREDWKQFTIYKDDSKNCRYAFNLKTIDKIYRNIKAWLLKKIWWEKQISIF